MKIQFLFWCSLLLVVLSCDQMPSTTDTDASTPSEQDGVIGISEGELKLLFRMEKVTGTLVIYDLKKDEYYIHDEARANQPFIPASTFKIANALIALETGVIRDDEEVIPWDGVNRRAKGWNRDHNLQSALEVSAVWVFQELARKIGKGRMQYWVRRMEYGNTDIGGDLDKFWLDGNLRITAMEQIDFLKKLYHNSIDISDTSMNLVKDILIKERNKNYTLRSKTGWSNKSNPQIGWNVGYVEKGDQVYFFALNIDINNDRDAKARVTLTEKAFNLMGVRSR